MSRSPSETVRRRLDAFRSRLFYEAVEAALYESADKVRAEAFRLISAGSVQGKGHVRSRPGEPPMREFGDLQAGLEVERVRPSRTTIRAKVTSNAKHSAPLEFSTSKMASRPFLRPARDKVAPLARTLLKLKIKQATRGL